MSTASGDPKSTQTEAFEFELTDFASAREALDESVSEIARHNARPVDAAEWAKRRRPASPADRALTGEAIAWMLARPQPVRPERMAAQMPRLVNQIAATWVDRQRCLGALRALTVDDRGGRRGLPASILTEVHALHRHLLDVPS